MKRMVLVFLIDAFGWDLQSERPFLSEFTHRTPLRTVFGFSSAAIPTLLSGRRPDEHGRWFLYRKEPAESPFGFARLLAPFDRGSFGRRVRRLFERCFSYSTDITGYYHLYEVPLRLLPWFDLPARRPIYLPGGIAHVPTLFDRLEAAHVPHRVWFWRTPEARNWDEVLAAAEEGSEPFLFFYGSELDALMHARGTGAPETRELIERSEERIRSVVDAATRRAGEVEVYVCSDHGMVDVDRVIDLMAAVRSLRLSEGRDYLPFYDSTFARFWFFRDDARRAVRDLLASTEGGRIVEDEELARQHVLFPDRAYGEIVFATHAGTVIAPSFMGDRAPAAMHGYHPEERGSDGLLVSSRPIPDGVGSIGDLAGLFERAALRAAGGEGNGART